MLSIDQPRNQQKLNLGSARYFRSTHFKSSHWTRYRVGGWLIARNAPCWFWTFAKGGSLSSITRRTCNHFTFICFCEVFWQMTPAPGAHVLLVGLLVDWQWTTVKCTAVRSDPQEPMYWTTDYLNLLLPFNKQQQFNKSTNNLTYLFRYFDWLEISTCSFIMLYLLQHGPESTLIAYSPSLSTFRVLHYTNFDVVQYSDREKIFFYCLILCVTTVLKTGNCFEYKAHKRPPYKSS